MSKGQVFLIGAGPGDIDLLTLGAVRCIRLADVILIDDLVNHEVLQFARPNIPTIYVGKRGGCLSTPQAFIHRKMIVLAQEGKVVARIKGGDPFIFGRGGEEMQTLQQAGIKVSIISGITSGMAVPASLNIPLTHRDYTQGVTFVTGHKKNERAPNWRALAESGTTLVIYMGMTNLAKITQQLMQHGLPANMPAIAIQHGTLPAQRHLLATLKTLPQDVLNAGFASPAIVVIGEVARFAESVNCTDEMTQFFQLQAA
ncbi:MAG: uroporphyrinogen-III C-methyltransferase [Candidatus Nitrotoga sp.]